MRQTQFDTAGTYLVFKKLIQRFNQLELQIFRQSSDIMMAFNALGCFSAGFYYVRINSALSQEFDTVQFTCFFFKNTDKFGADDFSFRFRISYASGHG